MTSSDSAFSHHAIIAGYGVPGRAVAEWCDKKEIPFIVIDLNEQIVERIISGGVKAIHGSISDLSVLKSAGIERAVLLAITVPDDEAALTATRLARQANPTVRIITRCAYTSAGLEATRRGADHVVVAEQVVAGEFLHVLAEK